MSDTIDKVSERLTGLEVTVAQGFHDLKPRFQSIDQSFAQVDRRFEQIGRRLTDLQHNVDRRFHDAEQRDLALSRKIDVTTESLRSDIKAVLDELRRGFDSIHKEHAADRDLLNVTLQQHARRLNDLETR